MPLLSDTDIDFALQGVSGACEPNVVYGTQSCFGDLKRLPVQEATESGLRRIGTSITLTIRDGALTGLVDDTTITADCFVFVIRDLGTVTQDGMRTLTLVEA